MSQKSHRLQAVERIRDYLVAQIKALRSPNINAQIIQQQNLIRYKDVWAFLAKNNTTLAEEIGQAYINTMRWYYSNNFSRYQDALNKMSLIRVGQTDTMGADPVAPKRKTILDLRVLPLNLHSEIPWLPHSRRVQHRPPRRHSQNFQYNRHKLLRCRRRQVSAIRRDSLPLL